MKRFTYCVELHEAAWGVGGMLIKKQFWFSNYKCAVNKYTSLINDDRNTGKIVVINESVYHLSDESKKVCEYAVISTLIN
jgi:hypothetical protein